MTDRIQDTEENRAKMQRVADSLNGSCGSIDDTIQNVFEDDQLSITEIESSLLEFLDDQVMECQGCNWWFDTIDIDDDTLCPECAKEKDNEQSE